MNPGAFYLALVWPRRLRSLRRCLSVALISLLRAKYGSRLTINREHKFPWSHRRRHRHHCPLPPESFEILVHLEVHLSVGKFTMRPFTHFRRREGELTSYVIFYSRTHRVPLGHLVSFRFYLLTFPTYLNVIRAMFNHNQFFLFISFLRSKFPDISRCNLRDLYYCSLLAASDFLYRKFPLKNISRYNLREIYRYSLHRVHPIFVLS